MDLKILLRKTGARLNFKIALISLHIDSELTIINKWQIFKMELVTAFDIVCNLPFE
jgi:hypothetical protein